MWKDILKYLEFFITYYIRDAPLEVRVDALLTRGRGWR